MSFEECEANGEERACHVSSFQSVLSTSILSTTPHCTYRAMPNHASSRSASVAPRTVTLPRDSCRFAWVASKTTPVPTCRPRTFRTRTQITPSADLSQSTLTPSADSAAKTTTAPRTQHGEYSVKFNYRLSHMVLLTYFRWYPTTRDEWAYTG